MTAGRLLRTASRRPSSSTPRRGIRKGPFAAVILLATLVLAGCGGAAPVTRETGQPLPIGSPSLSAPASPATDLAERKAAAGIADCPTSDLEVAPLSDGLPDVTLPCLGGGREVRLAGLRGTPLVINVWAQWCPPCRAEAPFLAAASEQFSGRVDFLGIDYSDARSDWAIDFAAAAGWTYPQVADEERKVQAALGVLGPPMMVFVSADGRIVHRHPGPITSNEQFTSLIDEHLGVR